MTEALTLGKLIDETRRSKNIRIKTLIEATNISRSTYNRIVNDESVVSLDVLIAIMGVLQLELSEVIDYIPTYSAVPSNQLKATAKLVNYWNDGPAGQQRLVDQVARLKIVAEHLATDGNVLNYHYAALVLAYMRQDEPETRRESEVIYGIVANYEDWTNFELTLLGEISTYFHVDWLPMVVAKIERYEQRLENSTDFNSMFVTNTFYLNMLQTSIINENLPFLRQTVRMVLKRSTKSINFVGLILRRFVVIADQMLAGTCANAEEAFTKMLIDVRSFADDELMVSYFKRMADQLTAAEWTEILKQSPKK